MIKIVSDPIDVNEAFETVRSEACGAVDIFVGTVRNKTKEKQVVRLEFEAYEEMAIKEMQKIADTASQKWPIEKLTIVHRTGILSLGEIAVIIAVSTPHRAASFAACQFIIDTLKQTVPIWKKEVFEGGEVWVAAHP